MPSHTPQIDIHSHATICQTTSYHPSERKTHLSIYPHRLGSLQISLVICELSLEMLFFNLLFDTHLWTIATFIAHELVTRKFTRQWSLKRMCSFKKKKNSK